MNAGLSTIDNAGHEWLSLKCPNHDWTTVVPVAKADHASLDLMLAIGHEISSLHVEYIMLGNSYGHPSGCITGLVWAMT